MSAINRSILWKLIITALVIIWAISAMVPFSDTPFETYIQTRATAHQDEFSKILKAAEKRIEKSSAKGDKAKSPTLYIALRDYADARVDHCPHIATKTFCSVCQTHCYKPEMRERIRQVMRWSGPRMLFHHPVLAVRHLTETRKQKKGQ